MNKWTRTCAVALLSVFPLAASALTPDWSNDKYNPPVNGNSTHVRIGYANGGESMEFGDGGPNTCDIPLIWSIHSGKALGQDEMAACALLEFDMHRDTKGDRRNMADQFVKADTVKEFLPRVLKRREELKAAKSYYFRSGMRLNPYNMGKQAFEVNLRILPVADYSVAGKFYVVGGSGIDSRAEWTVWAPAPTNTARDLEAARAGRKVIYSLGEVHFKVKSAGPGNPKLPDQRLLVIDDVKFALRFIDAQGQRRRVGTLPVN